MVVHNYVLKQHLRYPSDTRILKLYGLLPRMLLQQKNRDRSATTAADIRRRCNYLLEFSCQTWSTLLHVPDDQRISSPEMPTDAATIRMATHLVQQGEISKG